MNDRYEILLTKRVGRWRDGHVLSVTEINQFVQDQIEAGNAVVILEPQASVPAPEAPAAEDEDPEDQVKKPKIKKPKKGY